MSWWQSGVIALAGALIGAGAQGAVTLLVFRAQARNDRDLQWRTERRDLYSEVVDAAQAFVTVARQWMLLADLVRHHLGHPAGEDAEQTLNEVVAARDRLEVAVSRLALVAPAALVEQARLLLDPTRADPTREHLTAMLQRIDGVVDLARRDVGLGALSDRAADPTLWWPPDPPARPKG